MDRLLQIFPVLPAWKLNWQKRRVDLQAEVGNVYDPVSGGTLREKRRQKSKGIDPFLPFEHCTITSINLFVFATFTILVNGRVIPPPPSPSLFFFFLLEKPENSNQSFVTKHRFITDDDFKSSRLILFLSLSLFSFPFFHTLHKSRAVDLSNLCSDRSQRELIITGGGAIKRSICRTSMRDTR